MCIQTTAKVIALQGNTALMDDGRAVRLGMVGEVRVGEYLEIYADIAIGKIDTHESHPKNGKPMKGAHV